MLENFEEHTPELNDDELKLIPLLIAGFKSYNKDNTIKSNKVVERLNYHLIANNYKIKLTDARLRKLVNHIRTNGLLPLMASSKGYYVSFDKKDIESQIKSLKQRANSINGCAEGLKKFIK